ncbi:hypothetical protein Hypma_016571 [Hypsizygus marmoreus]|uniref:Uncharacterized protein n=1 Tax=Hypsizygus marmoreus TaxID=39966 RepID=A0A369J0L5_HYPMA|nr:hypothetical protein Hypma_016571 [Hypsizygus marmoreus]
MIVIDSMNLPIPGPYPTLPVNQYATAPEYSLTLAGTSESKLGLAREPSLTELQKVNWVLLANHLSPSFTKRAANKIEDIKFTEDLS